MRVVFSSIHLVLLCISVLLASTLLFPASALAHRVNIFAWTEGNVVHTEATFSSGNKAQKSRVIASEKASGTVISEGETNEDGMWSFTLSKDILQRKPDIVLSLNAGEGHANTWTIPAAEYAGAPPAPAAATSAIATSAGPEDMAPFMEETSRPAPGDAVTSGISKQDLQQIIGAAVDAALEKKLAPIRRQLAEESQHTPTLQDILGGIGYILGLMGVAAYMAARKRG